MVAKESRLDACSIEIGLRGIPKALDYHRLLLGHDHVPVLFAGVCKACKDVVRHGGKKH